MAVSLAGRRLSARLFTSASSGLSRSRSSFVFRGLIFASSVGAAYTFGALYPPTIATFVAPRTAPPPPDPDTPQSIAYIEALEKELHSLPLLQHHRSQQDSEEWYETRPYSGFQEEKRANHLLAGALRGPGKLAVRPIIRARKDERESWIFLHLGRGLCGHDGIIHGGLMASILDESLGRVAVQNVPAKVVVTANLSVNYRAPTIADQFIVIKTSLTEVKGRKAIVSARVEDMEGKLLQEASSIFVQPKYASMLNSKSIEQMVGVPAHAGPVMPSPTVGEKIES